MTTVTDNSPSVNLAARLEMPYDRRARVYRWSDGATHLTFTSEQKKSGLALQVVVAMLDPDLFAAAQTIIQTHPQLERGAWKAVEIVASNGVEIFEEMRGNVYGMVASSDGFGRYAITNEDGYTTCQCEHFTSFAAPMVESGNRYCKHILAYHLHLVTRTAY